MPWKFFDKYGAQRQGGSSEVQLDYAQITAPSAGVTATTEATATAVITGNSVLYDGSKVELEFFCPSLDSFTGTTNVVIGVFYMDGTAIGTFIMAKGDSQNVLWQYPIIAKKYHTPAAGAHTFSVRVYLAAAGTAVVGAGTGAAGSRVPAYLRVVKAT